MHCTENRIYVFPEKELRSLSPNSYIHVSVSYLYIFPGSVHIFGCRKIDRPILEIYINRSQIYECRNSETEHNNSVLETMRLHSFASGNTEMGTRHSYWILTGEWCVILEMSFKEKTSILIFLVKKSPYGNGCYTRKALLVEFL